MMLTPEERQELALLQQTLRTAASTSGSSTSLTRHIRNASPNVKAHILAHKEVMEHIDNGGRSMPFADRMTIDPKKVSKDDKRVLDTLKTEELSAGVLERMGTTASQQAIHYQPVTMREQLSAAFDHHEGSDHD